MTTYSIDGNAVLRLDGANYSTTNIAVGNAALENNTTGGYNTAVGNGALQDNTTGTQNTAVGRSALLDNTTGINNTAVGYLALEKNTIADNNTAVGVAALQINTTGGYNTAVGQSALQNNTIASYNTAVGQSALLSNTTGEYNTAVGRSALQNNETGTQNTAVGLSALQNNTIGEYNTAVGNGALQLNTTGSYNTAVGRIALQSNTTGSNNTAVGQSALVSNTFANNNTAVGYQALRYNTTGSNNTAVGLQALEKNTIANNNTAVGVAALRYMTGTGNIAVGTNALRGVDGSSTGGGNIALGQSAGQETTTGAGNIFLGNVAALVNATGSNNVAIGNSVASAMNGGQNNVIIGVNAGDTLTTGQSNIIIGKNAEPSSATVNNEITLGDANITDFRIPGVGFYIDGGNVGIGITSPSSNLHVKGADVGTAAGDQSLVGTFQANATNGNLLQISATREAAGSTWVDSGFRIQQKVDATFMGYIQFNGDNNDYGISFGAGADASAANVAERMRIDSSGNVGIATTTPSEKLDVVGNVTISGSLSKGSGSFKIDHPIKPDTHHLVHSFIEGPQADNIYRGKVVLVDGKATVNLDEAGRITEGTFIALNGNVQCFTTNEDGWTSVRGKIEGNLLTIEAQQVDCTDTVSWLVIGERHDQHMIEANWTDNQGRIITEPAK